jgi:chorismate mutase/prephenate dehydratase
MNLAQLRRKIDRLDAELVRLLNERTRIALEIGRVKHANGHAVYAPAREREVLARVTARSRGPLAPAALEAVYREIMSAALAMEGRLVVGVVKGDGGAMLAAREHFGGSVGRRRYASVAALLRAVQAGRLPLALISGADLRRARAGLAGAWFAAGRLAVCARVRRAGNYCVVEAASA